MSPVVARREQAFLEGIASSGQPARAILPSVDVPLAQLQVDLAGAKRRSWIGANVDRSDPLGGQLERDRTLTLPPRILRECRRSRS